MHAFYITILVKTKANWILLTFTTLLALISFLVGIAASISRARQHDPGWATESIGNAVIFQYTFYAAIASTDMLVSFFPLSKKTIANPPFHCRILGACLLRTWLKGNKKMSHALTSLLATPLFPGIASFALFIILASAEDRSLQLAILMPLGSFHVTFLLFYIIKKETSDDSKQETEANVPITKDNAVEQSKKDEGEVVQKELSNTVCYELPSSPLRSKASSLSFQSKSPERFILETSTPSFLRSDPYMICNSAISVSASNRGSPELMYYQEEEHPENARRENRDSKPHSPSSSTSTGTGKKRARFQIAPGRIVNWQEPNQ